MLRPAMPSRSAVLSQQRHAVQRAAVPRCGRAYGRHSRLLPVRATPEAGGAPPAAAAAPVAEAAAQPAEVSPPATFEKTVQQLREERIAPLRQALNDSIARHTQATGVREALEAEVCALFETVINAEGAEGSDVNLSEVAAAAMAAVEGAVKDEVEAAAVVAATQTALKKTLADLHALSGGEGEPAEVMAADAILAAQGADDSSDPRVAEAVALATAASVSSYDGSSPAEGEVVVPVNGAGSEAATATVVVSTPPAEVVPEATPAPAAASTSSSTPATTTVPVTAAVSAAAAAASSAQRAPSPVSEKDKAAAAQRKQLVRLAGVLAACAACYFAAQTPPAQEVIAAAQGALGSIHIGEAERGVLQTIWLLLSSVICVPAVVKLIPGGSPVLGYLIGGALVGPYALNIIQDVHQVQHLAELGVVFLLFTIGLELSLDRLQSMAKYVFGMGSAQVVGTLLGVAVAASVAAGLAGPSAIILGGALAMSTTAVAIQVLEDRGEMGSRHGRATFSVLLFQDLAVVVLLMLIPLLAPDPSGASTGMAQIAQALGLAAVKAVACIVGIIAGGRIFIRPLYKKISNLENAEIFAATTLLVVLGTSLMTQLAGLSLALGAFLAGLLIAETEYALQVESDIMPFKGLLMGLFFMTVGMQISVGLFLAKWKVIVASIVALLVGKLAVMMAAGQMFGLSRMASLRSGLLLCSGGEFAFVAFGEAVSKGVLPAGLTSELYLTVALSMALVPYLAALGGSLGKMFERSDMKALYPQESETNELRNHVIIAGYGRVGQIIAQMLSEQLIPFVALDVRSDRVQAGRALDLPVYFGDAGSAAVLHSVGAERAACAVITLDTPGANYRSVWAMQKHYPHVKTYVRAHDVNHGINLEKAGATVVVPEILEPSLQLAASVLSEFELPYDEVTNVLDQFRKKHLSELQVLAASTGTSLGYVTPKKKEAKEEAAGSEAGSDAVLTPAPA